MKIIRDAKGRFAGWRGSKKDVPTPKARITKNHASHVAPLTEHPLLLDEKFMRVYRGLNQAPKEEYLGDIHETLNEANKDRAIGMHWTSSLVSADFFATELDLDDTDWNRKHDFGIVLEGIVEVEHIVLEGTEEWNDLAYKNDIYTKTEDSGDFEQEVTVRPGSPVIIIAQHNVGKIRHNRVVRKVFPFVEPITRNT